jgi:predicted nucleotide-binding protein (sugar kinase/HSP70/actin superfamily)
MFSATELLRTSFIKGIAKTTASVTVLGVVTFFYYLYNNTNDTKEEMTEKSKNDIKNLYSIDFAKVFNNNKENLEIIEKDDIKETSNIVETRDKVNYVDLDVPVVYEEKNNKFKKLFDRL